MAKGSPDPEYILRRDSSPICAVCYHSEPGRKLLLSGNQNGQVQIWDLKTRQVIQSIDVHKNSILGIFTIEGKVITHGRDNAVHIWVNQKGSLEKSASIACGSSGFCQALVMSALQQREQTTIALPTDSSTIHLLSLHSQQRLGSLTPPPEGKNSTHGMVMCMATAGPTSIISAYENGSAVLWEVPCGKVLGTSKWYNDPVMCLTFNEATQTGAAGSVCNVLKVFSVSLQDQKLNPAKDIAVTNAGVNCVAFRRDGKILAAGGWDGNVRLFGSRKWNLLAVLQCHANSVQAACFNEDNTLAVGGKDGAISVWSVYK